jgi:dolichyl-phosphate-mannose-protein mannosyltransferase
MRRSERLFVFGILFAGAALRFWGLAFGVPHSDTRPEETTIVVTALGLLFAGLNPHFFRWPSLEFYIVSAMYRIGWEIGHRRGLYPLKYDMYQYAATHITPFLMVPRVLSAVTGVVTIWLVYTLMARLFDRLTALTAAFFLAVAFLHVRDSHFGLVDVPMTALVIAALVALSSAVEHPARLWRWALTGALCGLAASTKYNGGLVLAAAVASALVVLTQSERDRRPAVFRGMAILMGATLIVFICGTPYALLDAKNFLAGLQFDFRHLMDTNGIMLGRGWWYHLRFSLWNGLGAPLLIAGLAGMVLLLATSWKKAVMILTFPVLYYVVIGRGYTVLVRYMTPVVPFFCMTAALTVVWLVRRFASETLAPRIVTVAAIAIALPSLQRAVAFDSVIGRTDTRVLAADWTAAHVRQQESVGQIPPVLIYPDFGVPRPSNLVTFDVNRNAFVSASGATAVPDWIIVPTSPLSAYTIGADELPAIANRGYVRETTIAAAHGLEMPSWFDQQDPFFVPFTTFTMRDRPGPEIQIFRRRR